MSLWSDSSGATSGSSASRSVDRSTSVYISTAASLADQAARRARPRPLPSIRMQATPGSSAASRRAMSQVASVLPLSAMVTWAAHGNRLSR